MFKKKSLIIIIAIIIALLSINLFYKKENKEDKNPIVFNLGSDYNTLDPHLFTEMIAVQIDSSIYEGLLILDKDGNYTGGVAKSFVEDGNKLTFTLREDAKWSDGTDIEAKDFLFAFKRVLDPKVAAQYSEMLFPIKNAELYYERKVGEEELGVKVIDKKTLEIELEQPTAYFKYILTLPITTPLKEEFYNKAGEKFSVELDGFLFNGPYKIVELKDDEINLEKNEHYWNKDNIKLSKIRYIISRDFKAVDNLIKNKEIDISRVEFYNLENYKKNNTLDSNVNGRIWYLEYNLENNYLKNENLRKAISMSIDRKKYVDEIKKDGSVVAKSIISSTISGSQGHYRQSYPYNDYISNNIDEAKQLYKKALEELGVSELRLRLLSGNSDPEVLEIQFIQEELRTKLGLETDVETVPFKERLTKTRAADYDITLNTWSPKFDDPLSYLERWRNKESASIWSKDKYNDLVNTLSKMPQSVERDKVVNEAELILINEDVISPLYFSVENHYRNPKIQGIVKRPITGITEFRWAYKK